MKDFAMLCMTSATASRYRDRNIASVVLLALALMGAAMLPPPPTSSNGTSSAAPAFSRAFSRLVIAESVGVKI